MGLGKFILLGHSLGGYLSACYALKHPEVSHPHGISEASFAFKYNNVLHRHLLVENSVMFPLITMFHPLIPLSTAS